jgi:hypothetical protein
MKVKLYLKEWVVMCTLREYHNKYWYYSLLKLLWLGEMAIQSPKPWEYIEIAILIN